MKKRSKFKKWLVNGLLVLLFLIGIAMVFNNQIRNYLMEWKTSQYEMSKVTKEQTIENQQMAGSFDFEAVQPVSTQAVIDAQFKNKRLPVIGGIAIPSVAINLPIFKGISNEVLLYGAGTMSPDQKMGEGNYALASHRTDRADLLFTPLEKIKQGEVVYLTDKNQIYTYTVYKKERVQPTRVDVLDEVPDKKIITLITCGELTGQTRIIVQAELTATTAIDQATTEMRDAFQLPAKSF